MRRNKFVRIMCIFLAILMLGSVAIGVLQAFALEPQVAAIPMTGDGNTKAIIGIVAGVAAVLLIGLTVVPKIIGKKNG